jgi:hypothetical protein
MLSQSPQSVFSIGFYRRKAIPPMLQSNVAQKARLPKDD